MQKGREYKDQTYDGDMTTISVQTSEQSVHVCVVYNQEFHKISIFTVIFHVSFDLTAAASLHRGSMFSLVKRCQLKNAISIFQVAASFYFYNIYYDKCTTCVTFKQDKMT